MQENKVRSRRCFSNQSASWTPQEEFLLGKIIEEEGPQNWNKIAEKLFAMTGKNLRTGKQCRQRYMNAMKFEEVRETLLVWTTEEIEKLFARYTQFGSKWTLIAKQFPNKSENCLKNKLYGSIRMLARKLNQIGKKTKTLTNKLRYQSVLKPLEYKPKPNSEIYCGGISLDELKMKIIDTAAKGVGAFSEYQMLELTYCVNRFNLSTRSSNPKKHVSKKEMPIAPCSKDQGYFQSNISMNFQNSDKQPSLYQSFQLQIDPQMKPTTEFSINLIDYTLYEPKQPINSEDSPWRTLQGQDHIHFFTS